MLSLVTENSLDVALFVLFHAAAGICSVMIMHLDSHGRFCAHLFVQLCLFGPDPLDA